MFLTAFGDADTEPPAAAGGRLMTMVELIAARGLWGGELLGRKGALQGRCSKRVKEERRERRERKRGGVWGGGGG